MRFVCLFLIVTVAKAENPQANKLFQEYFEWKIDSFKVNFEPISNNVLSNVFYYQKGYDKHAGEIDDYSEERFRQIGRDCEDFQRRADNLLQMIGAKLEKRDHRYVRILRKECEFCARGIDVEGFFFPPIHFMGGVHSSWPNFFGTKGFLKLETDQDFANALNLLGQIPKQLEQIQTLCEKGIARGLVFHEASISRAIKQYNALLSNENPEESKFFVPFKVATQDIQESAKVTIQNEVLPAYKKLKSFVENVYMKIARKWPGLSSVPNGEQKYQKYLEYHTTIEGITPEEVHNLGLSEVQRIKKLALNTAEEKLEIQNATLKSISESLKNDPKQAFTSAEEELEYFQNIIDKINPKLKEIMDGTLLTNETYNLNLLEVPKGMGGLAYYYSPSVDGRRKGAFYLNTQNLDNIKKFETNSLTLHEGNPGHHLQLSFGKYSPNPDFLKHTLYVWEVPGIPLNYNSHIEGWGLYAEYLGYELGMFEDPKQEIGFFSWNLLRACRLVVDTGIHALGWSRQRAIDYLLENTAMSLPAIEQQIDRYITLPGQATSYKIGEMKVREIRQRREKALGQNFDLGAFHRHILTCIGPIEMLEECVIEEEQLPFPEIKITTPKPVATKSTNLYVSTSNSLKISLSKTVGILILMRLVLN